MNHFLSNEQLLNVFRYTKTATAIHVGEDAVIQTANDAMLAIWGKDKSVIGKSLEQALPELKGQPFIEMFRNVWLQGLTIAGTDTAAELVVNGQRTTFYFDFEYRAIKDEAGKTICILHSAIDVTDRVMGKLAMERLEEKNASLLREQELNEELATTNEELQATVEELQATNEELQLTQEKLNDLNNQLEHLVLARTHDLTVSEGRLRSVFEQSPLAFCILSGPDLIVELANDNMLKLWSAGKEIIGLPHAKARPQPETAQFLQVLDEVYRTGIPFTGKEIRAFTAKGNKHEWGYFNFTYQPLTDQQGKVNGIVAIVDDVSEAVLARQESAQMNQQLNMAIDAARLGAWHLEPVNKKLSYNTTLAKLFGYEGEEPMTYEQAIAQVTDGYREKIEFEIDKAIREGGDYDITYQQKRFNDGAMIWLRSLGRLSRDSNGEWTVFSGFVMDITEQKKEEERKNDFIGMVSHELKTPLTTLQGYLQLAQTHAQQDGDGFMVSALEQTVKQVRKMTTMINGFLNVSRLESGKIHIDRKTFDMALLVQEIVEETGVFYAHHKIKITHADAAIVYADRDKIGQVLSNLVSNAAKYSGGQPLIAVACEKINGVVRISVTDDGIGIEEKHLTNIFTRYYRVQENTTVSGFGIGLYLSAEIIGRHQGRIWAESEHGKGSVFYFTIPLHNK